MQKIADKKFIDQKIDELVELLTHPDMDIEKIRQHQQRFNDIIDYKTLSSKSIDAFKVIDQKKGKASREELLEEFSFLLSSNKFDTKVSNNYLKFKRINRLFLLIISVVMIVVGFWMLIMPMSPESRGFILFHFNNKKGITIMDVVLLGIVISGIYLMIKALNKKY